MTLGKVFHWFYCLPILDAVLLVSFGTFIFLFLKSMLDKHIWWKYAIFAFLIAWMGAMLYTTIGNREAGILEQHSFTPFHSYRAVLNGDNPEILRSNFMNVVLFYPAGLLGAALLPQRWSYWCRVLFVLILFTLVSAGIEYAQYAYALGRVEIDDVIHNALGALLGGIFGVVNLNIH